MNNMMWAVLKREITWPERNLTGMAKATGKLQEWDIAVRIPEMGQDLDQKPRNYRYRLGDMQ